MKIHPFLKYVDLTIIRVILAATSPAFGQTGYDVAKSVDERPEPADMKTDLTMILTNSKGQTRTSTLRLINDDGGKKQMRWLLSPADDKVVSFLKIEHDDQDDELRLWLPAFKKVRRISSNKKSEAFMGSDLSYEDMTNRELNENDYELLKEDEVVLNIPCFVIQTVPKPIAESEYSRHVTWIAMDGRYPVNEESYDHAGKLLKSKTFIFKKQNDFWIPTEIYVENIQKTHNTRLNFKNIHIDTGVDDDLFQEKNLKRLPIE